MVKDTQERECRKSVKNRKIFLLTTLPIAEIKRLMEYEYTSQNKYFRTLSMNINVILM